MLLVCPKSIGRFHSEFAQMLEFMDGFQLVLISLDVLELPQGFRSMDLIIAWYLTPIGRVPRIVVLDIRAILVGIVVFDVGRGLSGSSGRLRLGGVRLSDP